MKKSYDVAVVGAGVIGLSIALRLAREGHSVVVLDAGEPGMGASWAASGALALIMPDLAPADLRPLAAHSQALWREFVGNLEEACGFAVELLNSGLLRLLVDDEQPTDAERTVEWQREHDVRVENLDNRGIRSLSPIVGEHVQRAYYEPHLLQVRTPRLMRALSAAAQHSKVAISANNPVLTFVTERERVLGVDAVSGRFLASEVVLTAGAHSGDLARRSLGIELPVRPVRGQLVLLDGVPVPRSPLLLGTRGNYLVPRADGRILAGSTFELVGFNRRTTATGINGILNGVLGLAPALGQARVASTWAGLRPETPDRLPYLGRIPGLSGLVVATGHFRDGILLAPVTAQVISDVVQSRPPAIDIARFAPDRSLSNWRD